MTDAPAVWQGDPPAPGTRRIGFGPEDVPEDGEWRVMRSSPWLTADMSAADRRIETQKILQAVKYLRRTGPEGFEVGKVNETNEQGEKRWHMLGRWKD